MKMESSLNSLGSELGLTEYELKIYAASVELGRATANRIAKKTGIPRTSVYSTLDRLQEKGLVALERKKGVQAFLAASPHSLVTMAQEQVTRAQQGLARAKQISEMLESTRGRDAITSSKILIYEGRSSIRTMLSEWEQTWRDSVVTFGRPWGGFQDESFLKHYGDTTIRYWERFKEEKYEAQNQLRLFQEQGEVSRKIEARIAKIVGQRRKLRPLPGINKFSATLWLVGEYLIILKTQDDPHYALQIRDQLLTENVYAIFDRLWQMTNP